MSPELSRLGHVALETPDLEESVWFFRDVLGLEEVERSDETVYLRSLRDWEHHTVSLTQADSGGIDHIAWRASEPDDLQAFADQFEADGVDIEWIDAGEETGQGEAIRFQTDQGHRFEIYYDVEKPDAPEERRSRLANRVYDEPGSNRIAPRRIDHVNLQVNDPASFTTWMEDTLDFRLNEYFDKADGTRHGSWMSVTPLTHDVGFHPNPDGDEPRFHHIAYYVETIQDLFEAADHFRENGIELDAGPGQHAITQAKFLYVKDPASNVRVELYTGGYLIFDPDWEAIGWNPDDAGVFGDHQWVGQSPTWDAVPY